MHILSLKKGRNGSIFIRIIGTVMLSLLFTCSPGFAGSTSSSTTPGIDVLECSTKAYCYYNCSNCCTVTSVQNISKDQFNTYRQNFVMDSFYTKTVEKSYQSQTDETRNVDMYRLANIGAFLDASIFNDTLRALQVLSAKTLQTYTTSEQICRFGTLGRSLSASDARVDHDRIVLGAMGLARNLGKKNTSAAAGRGKDFEYRLYTFVDQYCDLSSQSGAMSDFCQVATPVGDVTRNRDVDYTRLLDAAPTINADLTNTSVSQDEAHLSMLANYLYGHRLPDKRMDNLADGGNGGIYDEYRSVFARRAAAQNTYNTLAAMKMAGSGASDTYIQAMLKQIGMDDNAIATYLKAKGDSKSPAVASSYNAQMNMLTKQIFQDPAFYANLMESKTNVKRTSAAIQGVGLMQTRDIYRSIERSEMLLAIMVELEARKLVEDNQGAKNN